MLEKLLFCELVSDIPVQFKLTSVLLKCSGVQLIRCGRLKMFVYIWALWLKLAVMGLGLFSLQVTHYLFKDEIFLQLNALIFCVGLHTCLTYHAQVSIWEKIRIRPMFYFQSVLIALSISVLYVVTTNSGWILIVAFTVYLFCKSVERIAYNSNITRGKITKAYVILIGFLMVEISVFGVSYSFMDGLYARFLLPAVALMAGVLVCFTYNFLKTEVPFEKTDNGEPKLKSNFDSYFFSLHSFFILFTLMVDRILMSWVSMDEGFEKGSYLLMFSYASAIYAVGTSGLEVIRPRLFELAKKSDSLFQYLKISNLALVSICILFGGLVVGSVGQVVISYRWFLSIGSSDLNGQVWFFLCIFFSVFLSLAMIQIYCLANRKFKSLFLSWIVALFVRLAGVVTEDWVIFMFFSSISGLVAITILVAWER